MLGITIEAIPVPDPVNMYVGACIDKPVIFPFDVIGTNIFINVLDTVPRLAKPT